jgi:mannose-6-phosphate isomerase-like protein (cupin superfamily)
MQEKMSNYNKNIVKKPWGYEYLAYQNENVGLWFLYIKPNQSTSMHCHPKKTTGLVLLDGEAEISFLADKRKLTGLDKVMIRRGLFHSTNAISNNGAYIFEIETPVDKHDLVRLNDRYGRTSKPYEDNTFEETKADDCLWIEEPALGECITYSFANCILKLETIDNIDVINNKEDNELIMFLKGGLVRDIDNISHCVTIPGDVGFASIIKKVSKQLDGVISGTLIMTIIKNG